MLASIGVRDGKVQAVAIDERGNDAAVDKVPATAAMVRLRVPGGDGFIAIPVALDTQAFFIVGAAAMAMID